MAKVTKTETVKGEQHAGQPEGTVLESVNEKGKIVKEKIVYDYDDDGNYAGFHKEVVSG